MLLVSHLLGRQPPPLIVSVPVNTELEWATVVLTSDRPTGGRLSLRGVQTLVSAYFQVKSSPVTLECQSLFGVSFDAETKASFSSGHGKVREENIRSEFRVICIEFLRQPVFHKRATGAFLPCDTSCKTQCLHQVKLRQLLSVTVRGLLDDGPLDNFHKKLSGGPFLAILNCSINQCRCFLQRKNCLVCFFEKWRLNLTHKIPQCLRQFRSDDRSAWCWFAGFGFSLIRCAAAVCAS